MPPKPTTAGSQSYNPCTQEDDYYDDEEDDEQIPGPGSYFNPHQSTTFKIKAVPERLQFFGSTVERFYENTNKNKVPPNIGPGSYSVPNGQKLRNANAPFLSTNQRFIEQQTKVEVPGPGSYQTKTLVEQI